LMFKGINKHYRSVAAQLRAARDRPRVLAGTRVVVLVPGIDEAVMRAIGYARALRPMELKALFVGDERSAESIRAEWESRRIRVPLDVVTAEGDFVDAVRSYVRRIEREGNEFVTVVVPETLRRRGLRQFLVQRKELMLKAAMLFEPQVVLTDVPWHEASSGEASGPIV